MLQGAPRRGSYEPQITPTITVWVSMLTPNPGVLDHKFLILKKHRCLSEIGYELDKEELTVDITPDAPV